VVGLNPHELGDVGIWGPNTSKLWNITMLLMGKSTISMAIFNSFLYVYQRVLLIYLFETYWC